MPRRGLPRCEAAGKVPRVDLEFSAITDVGLRRGSNEDSYLAEPATNVFAVADGMGGHAAGEVASAMAIEALRSAIGSASGADWLRDAVAAANHAIVQRSAAEADKRGMGTTLTALAMAPGAYRIAHVGDSRAYLVRDHQLRQLTVDHTWVQREVERGALTPEQARVHPLSSVLTRSLGIDDPVEIDIVEGDVLPADLFLLCSDGLTGMVSDTDLRTMLVQDIPLDALARQLVEAANLRGGADNITAILIRAAA